jgi:hypothetical protein
MRSALLLSAASFALLNGTVLLDEWISGDTTLQSMLGTAALIAGLCVGLFAIVAAFGLVIPAKSEHDRADRPGNSVHHGATHM